MRRRTIFGVLGPLILILVVTGAWGQITTRDPWWRTVGAGVLASRPATCAANRDVYICNGAGCPASGVYYYCTAANTWTLGSAGTAGVQGAANLTTAGTPVVVSATGAVAQSMAVPAWRKYQLVKLAVGTIRAAILNDGGTGYEALDVLEVDGGTGGTIEVDTVDESGVITGATLTAGGSGYTSTIGATAAGGTGEGATFDITSSGSWSVNGGTAVLADAALTQDVALFELPARGHVTDWRIKTNTACTGTTTAKTGLGTTGSNVLFRAQTYDIQAAVSDTNLTNGPTAGTGSETHATTNIVASLITTVKTVDALVSGCTLDLWVQWAVLP